MLNMRSVHVRKDLSAGSLLMAAILYLLGSLPLPAFAQEESDVVGVFEGQFGDVQLSYRAAVETLPVAVDEAKATLTLFSYVAEEAQGQRPITFFFNGGPIAPSAWLHLAAFGPKRFPFPDDPAESLDGLSMAPNPSSPLDVSDLVFIDPATTGYSRVIGDTQPSDFFSVGDDAAQIGEAIVAWIQRHERQNDPIFIFGESYGTNRAAALVAYLAENYPDLNLEGVVFFGQALNIIEYAQRPMNVVSYAVSLPSLAATAVYHGKAEADGRSLDEIVQDAIDYAQTEYIEALFLGKSISDRRKRRVAARLAKMTGVSETYYLENDLKITKMEFRRELLREQELVTGFSDSRYVGPASERGDPMYTALAPGLKTAVEEYIQGELGGASRGEYLMSSPVQGLDDWDWGHGISPFSDWPYASYINDAFEQWPTFRVFVANGVYDLSTTVGGAAYLVDQADWPTDRVRLKLYDGGHMAYTIDATAEAFGNDLRAFIGGEQP